MNYLPIGLVILLYICPGVCAQEVHLCGEGSAIELIRQLTAITGDVFEVRKYKRLTSLTVLDRPVG